MTCFNRKNSLIHIVGIYQYNTKFPFKREKICEVKLNQKDIDDLKNHSNPEIEAICQAVFKQFSPNAFIQYIQCPIEDHEYASVLAWNSKINSMQWTKEIELSEE